MSKLEGGKKVIGGGREKFKLMLKHAPLLRVCPVVVLNYTAWGGEIGAKTGGQ